MANWKSSQSSNFDFLFLKTYEREISYWQKWFVKNSQSKFRLTKFITEWLWLEGILEAPHSRQAFRPDCPEPRPWRHHHLLGQPVPIFSHLHSEKRFPDIQRTSCVSVCGHCLCSCCWAPLRRAWPCPLCTLPSGIWAHQWNHSWTFSSLAEQCQKPDWSPDSQYPLLSPHLPRHPILISERRDETRVKAL